MNKDFIKSFIITFFSIVKKNTDSKIIFYHDIYADIQYTEMGTSLAAFRRHIQIINEEGFSIVREIKRKKKDVLICLDDGFRGIWDIRDFLKENEIPLIIFIPIDKIGQDGYLKLEEVLELQKIGVMFQCHSWSHVDLTALDELNLEHELLDAKQKLQTLLGVDVDSICFPKGFFSKLVCEKAYEFGFKKLYSSIWGNFNDTKLPYNVIPRNLVQYSSAKEFRAVLNGGSLILKRRILNKAYIK